MKAVSPGEPILDRLTAQWFNNTLGINGNAPTPPREDQPGLTGLYSGVNRVDTYSGLIIDSLLSDQKPDFVVNLLETTEQKVNRWVVGQQSANPGQTIEYIESGLTLARVEILNTAHTHVTYSVANERLESSFTGRGLLVAKTDGPLHLISLSPITLPAIGIAYTGSHIPARSGARCGSRTCILSYVTEAGDICDTGVTETIWNSQTQEAFPGYIQFKEMYGKLFVDVSPCPVLDVEGDPIVESPLGSCSTSLRNFWPFRGWS